MTDVLLANVTGKRFFESLFALKFLIKKINKKYVFGKCLFSATSAMIETNLYFAIYADAVLKK